MAKNGNLLINVGPAADGSIPELQRRAMRELGTWLAVNGDAIYGTRPWIRMGERTGAPRRYTTTGATVHVHALDPSTGTLELTEELLGSDLRWTDGSVVERQAHDQAVAVIPAGLREEAVAVLSAG